jgi:hypothetical protein
LKTVERKNVVCSNNSLKQQRVCIPKQRQQKNQITSAATKPNKKTFIRGENLRLEHSDIRGLDYMRQALVQGRNTVTLHTKQFRKADTNNFSLTVKTKAG